VPKKIFQGPRDIDDSCFTVGAVKMGKYRERFNAKARTGMVAKQQALKRARQKSFNAVESENGGVLAPQDVPDPNAELLLPMTTEEKLERKRKLEETLKPPETKMSRAKRKRLDKYIVCDVYVTVLHRANDIGEAD
jgi:hypothetical protein